MNVLMLVCFVCLMAYELEDSVMILNVLWDPTAFLLSGGIIFGGLSFAYGKIAIRPWGDLIVAPKNHDNFEIAKTIGILNTTQKLVIVSGVTMCFLRILKTLGMFSSGYEVIAYNLALALCALLGTRLVSLLFIVPVKAYWESQTLPNDE